MLDPQLIRNKLDTIVEESLRRGVSIDKNKIKKIEDNRKKIQVETEELQSERNNISKKIGELKSKGDQTENLLEKVTIIKKQLEQNEEKLNSIQKELNELLIAIPNIPHKSVPNGDSDADNKLIREWGEKPKFDFKIKDHVDLGESLNQIDFDSAVKV